MANTTKDVPIVLGAVTDPVGANLVADMDKPGGNITGVSDKTPVATQFELAQELMPEAKSVGILYSSTEDNSSIKQQKQKRPQKIWLDVKNMQFLQAMKLLRRYR